MRSPHAEAVALNLPQDLAIEVRRHANRAAPILQVADPCSASLIVGIRSSNLSQIEGASITVTKRRWSTRSCRVEPNPSQCRGGKIDPPVRKILINVPQDIRSLHRCTEGTGGVISLRIVADAHTEKCRHQATDGTRNLIAVEIEIRVTLHDWTSKVTLHAVEECTDRIGWE
jgi:hypothetical protein